LGPAQLISLNRFLLLQPRQRSPPNLSLASFVEQPPRITAGNRVATKVITDDLDAAGTEENGPTLNRSVQFELKVGQRHCWRILRRRLHKIAHI
jgi:hypothetical protein